MGAKREIKEIGYIILSEKDCTRMRPGHIPALLAESRNYPFDYKKYNPIIERDTAMPLGFEFPRRFFVIHELYYTFERIFWILEIPKTTRILIHIEYERLRWDWCFHCRAYNPHLLSL